MEKWKNILVRIIQVYKSKYCTYLEFILLLNYLIGRVTLNICNSLKKGGLLVLGNVIITGEKKDKNINKNIDINKDDQKSIIRNLYKY